MTGLNNPSTTQMINMTSKQDNSIESIDYRKLRMQSKQDLNRQATYEQHYNMQLSEQELQDYYKNTKSNANFNIQEN